MMMDNEQNINVIPAVSDEELKLPAEELSFEAQPEEAVKEEQPFEAQSEEVPAEAVSEEAPAEEQPEKDVSEVPQEETPVEEVPAEEQSEETTEEEQPEEALQEEEPEEVPAEEQPEETPAEEQPEEEPAPKDLTRYHNRYYLLYGDDHEPARFDTKGTIGFLESIGVTGGELGQARRGKELSSLYENLAGEQDSNQRCSYCGCPIRGADYYRLNDGRLRCTMCTRTQVKTTEELKEIFERVKNNLMIYFGADITVPVKVEMLDERKLKRKLGKGLDDPDDKNMLVLGVAVKKHNEFTIYLENGAPRITVIATLAHEMTHIWQYTHWDDKEILSRYGARNRLTVYEGMAMWTEIQYLYLVGELSTAKRDEQETADRKDEYGVGFCAYTSVYPIERAGMSCAETPFSARSSEAVIASLIIVP